MTSLTVATDDLRQALRSVAPHADPDPDFPPLHRVRLEVGPVNLTVSATNRYTVGHALVSVEDNHDGELASFDLSPQDVKEILALFKGKAGEGEQPDDTLRIDVTDKHVTVTDVSGLFPGKSLSLPRYPDESNFPSVSKLIADTLTKDATAPERLVTSGKFMGLFTHAAKAYGESLVMDPTGSKSALLISCGDSFIGLLMPVALDEEEAAKVNGWHSDWLTRLGDTVSGYAPRS